MKSFGFDLLAEQVSGHVTSEVSWQRDYAPGATPIEKLFFLALNWRCGFSACKHNRFIAVRTEKEETKIKGYPLRDDGVENILIIRPQAEIKDRRVDFLIHVFDWSGPASEWKWKALIIECDGHDFHERTKEQVTKDRARDRDAIMAGIDCFRFTGSELWRDPWGCAVQVTDWAERGWGPE